MAGICDGRVVIVTGAGRGIGREHALELARQGASVVVNDIDESADAVVAEVEAAGGRAIANHDDVASWDSAAQMVSTAVDVFGGLDAVVNNAGFVRDRMFVSCSEDEWDSVVAVHLKGHFCVSRQAAAWWRDRAKASGGMVDARIINTSSGAGLLGSVGQSAYSAAKGGIATLTLVQAAELARYGITANAIAPAARTRMTEGVFAEMMARPDDPSAFDAMDPANVAPLVAWLCSPSSAHVTGQVFEVEGGKLSIAEGWHHGEVDDAGRRRNAAEVGDTVDALLAKARPPDPVYGSS